MLHRSNDNHNLKLLHEQYLVLCPVHFAKFPDLKIMNEISVLPSFIFEYYTYCVLPNRGMKFPSNNANRESMLHTPFTMVAIAAVVLNVI